MSAIFQYRLASLLLGVDACANATTGNMMQPKINKNFVCKYSVSYITEKLVNKFTCGKCRNVVSSSHLETDSVYGLDFINIGGLIDMCMTTTIIITLVIDMPHAVF